VLVFVLPTGSIKNITPVSTLDILPVLKGVPFIFSVNSYVFIFYIFNDQIEYGKTKNFRKFVYTAVFLLGACTLIVMAILSAFCCELPIDLNFPFLAAVDNVSVLNSSVGLSALFYASWVTYEFVAISVFVYAALRLLRDIFSLQGQTPALTATAGLCFFFTLYLCGDSLELQSLSYNIVAYVNLILFVALPVALFITAKFRNMLPAPPKRQQILKQPPPRQ
jgi:hypothetical protein